MRSGSPDRINRAGLAADRWVTWWRSGGDLAGTEDVGRWRPEHWPAVAPTTVRSAGQQAPCPARHPPHAGPSRPKPNTGRYEREKALAFQAANCPKSSPHPAEMSGQLRSFSQAPPRPRKAAHLAGFICPHCPHSKTVCPQCKWGQISSMVTTTYKRFCSLSPLSPRKKNDPPKETAESEVHPAPWCPHFRGHFAHLAAIRW